LTLEGIVVRDADLPRLFPARLFHAELVQVIVEPAHRVLDGDVQIPEAVGFRHLDASPNRRLDLFEDDLELEDSRLVLRWRSMAIGAGAGLPVNGSRRFGLQPTDHGGGGRGGDQLAVLKQLGGEEADVLAASHDAPLAQQPTDPGRPRERDVEIERGRELAGTESGRERRPHRVIEHGGQEPALDVAGGVRELRLALELHLDGAGLGRDLANRDAERRRRPRRRELAVLDLPEERRSVHADAQARGGARPSCWYRPRTSKISHSSTILPPAKR
jgi:hypothetical protein